MERLEALRRRIRTVDSALLALVAERMELAREVGAEKRQRGRAAARFRGRKAGARARGRLGLPPELAHDLMRLLIEESCRVQEIGHHSAYSGTAESVAVLGGAGRMGGWLVRFLETQGHRVRVVDAAAPADADLRAALWEATLAFVATPLAGVGERLDEIVASGFSGAVCDVASVKGHLRPAIERAMATAGAWITDLRRAP